MSGKQDFNELLGLVIVGEEDGRFVIELDIEDHHLHSAGRVHGGVYLTLLDTVMSRAMHHAYEGARVGATVELKTNFLRPCSAGRVRAYGDLINKGRRINYLEAELKDSEDRLLAKASATMMFVDT